MQAPFRRLCFSASADGTCASAESERLQLKDWIENVLRENAGESMPEERYVLYVLGGRKEEGLLDENAYGRVENALPGPYRVASTDLFYEQLPNVDGSVI